jgi:hypothetical protein
MIECVSLRVTKVSLQDRMNVDRFIPQYDYGNLIGWAPEWCCWRMRALNSNRLRHSSRFLYELSEMGSDHSL